MTGFQIPAQPLAGQKAVHSFPLRPTVRPISGHQRQTLLELGEVLLILIWAIIVGFAFLNPSPQIWPLGPEYPSSVTANYVWTFLPKCGTCIFWNGLVGGGAPAFSDIFASLLHPLVILAVLLRGVVNGTKTILIASFFIAGFSQWWLTRIMGLGRIARLFCAAMAVAGGHLAARMELGPMGLLFSTACCSLVIAPAVGLGLTGKRRYTILLALVLSSALLSGQGYMQVGLALSVLPALLIFVFDGRMHLRPVWKEFLLAGGLALLLAGVFLVPMLHFYPNINKFTDPAFNTSQNIGFIPLNLVIDDKEFYQSTSLKSAPYPHLYADYLGWTPVLLAILALRFIPRAQQRLLIYLLAALGLVYLASSSLTLRGLAYLLPVQASGVRFTPILAALANPLVLGLSAWGLDGLVRLRVPDNTWLALERKFAFVSKLATGLGALALIVTLGWSLKSAYDFGHGWLDTFPIGTGTYAVAQALVTPSTEWVDLPFGQHYWAIPAFEAGLKLANGVRSWKWDNHEFPPAFREGTRAAADPKSPDFITSIFDINIVAHPENEYAYIKTAASIEPCQAHALGGNIDVVCPLSGPGQLVVHEYYYTGWKAWRNGASTALLASPWLSVDAPPGQHQFSFRYRPWDVWAGMACSLAGLIACLVLWRNAKFGRLL